MFKSVSYIVFCLLPGQNQPQRTTMMKLSTLSTLWDYINRAMPWNAPKSLSADDVYASTAYILYLSDVLPADFVLSEKNIRDVQARLPNRNGMTTAHSLWPGSEFGGKAAHLSKPDAQGSACMTNCVQQVSVVGSLPDHARDAHGNLAEQSRLVGPSRGAQTLDSTNLKTAQNGQNSASNLPSAQSIPAQVAPEKIATSVPTLAQIKPLLDKNACLACHGMSTKLVGPSLKDVAERYKTHNGAANLVAGKIKSGGQGGWGAIPMPAQALSVAEANQIAQWLMGGMPP